MKKILVVVDMQNDFVDGALGSKEAQAIVPNVLKKILNFNGRIIFTKDTHFESDNISSSKYADTLEGKLLPVPHCLISANNVPTKGHELNRDIDAAATAKPDVKVIWKYTFGSMSLPAKITEEIPAAEIESIEVCGLCTDICVVSNALILRAAFPNVPMKVDSACCAGTSQEAHEAALKVMKSCQIEVV